MPITIVISFVIIIFIDDKSHANGYIYCIIKVLTAAVSHYCLPRRRTTWSECFENRFVFKPSATGRTAWMDRGNLQTETDTYLGTRRTSCCKHITYTNVKKLNDIMTKIRRCLHQWRSKNDFVKRAYGRLFNVHYFIIK